MTRGAAKDVAVDVRLGSAALKLDGRPGAATVVYKKIAE